jgi:hypothetical protein
MADMNQTAAEFLGPPLAGRLSQRAKQVTLAQLNALHEEILGHQPPHSEVADLSLTDLHSIRDAFAPFTSRADTAAATVHTATAACCCCCPCCSCGTACSSSCA